MTKPDRFTFTITQEEFSALLFALGTGIGAAHQEGNESMRDRLHIVSADLLTQHELQMRSIAQSS